VSGCGWSFGYLGGMLALGISLAYVLWAQGQGQTAAQFVPVTMLITAAIYAVAALTTFALLRERALPQAGAAAASGSVGAALARLGGTWREARRYRDFSWFLACCVSYQAGISVVITLAAVYAEQAMGFKQTDTMMLIFLVNIAAALGAFAFGYWQDRIGHRPALSITLVGWIVMVAMAAAAQGPALFWVAAVIAGLCMGSSQSAGRALAGTFAPAAQRAEFFGLWSFAVRLAAIIGPLTYGLITWATGGNHRVAILSTAVFFVVGLVLLQKVDVKRGEASALAAA
jgi:UMF1 family MFS transporter